MLTQVRLEMLPGDKRLLNLTLPKDARFWFAFVNQNGVWPWREQDRILIPLEQQSRGGKAMPVEIFYSSQVGEPAAALARSGVARAEVRSAAGKHHLARLSQREVAGEELDRHAAIAGGAGRAASPRPGSANLSARRGRAATREDQGSRADAGARQHRARTGRSAAGPPRVPVRLRSEPRTTPRSTKTPACNCTTSSCSRRSSA